MVTDGNYTSYGEHIIMCINVESQCCTNETNIILCQLCLNKKISLNEKIKIRHSPCSQGASFQSPPPAEVINRQIQKASHRMGSACRIYFKNLDEVSNSITNQEMGLLRLI